MRLALALSLIATVASADPLRDDGTIRRRRASSVMLIAPATRPRKQPAVDEAGRVALQRAAMLEKGHAKIAALDALIAALEELSPPDAELELLMTEISAQYLLVLEEPALDTYRYADELMVRAAKGVTSDNDKLAAKVLERMLVKFPKSPFAFDAHLRLAQIAENDGKWKPAIAQYQTIVATEQRAAFATFARLRLGWVHHLAGDDKQAVRELAGVITGEEPQLADAAADLVGECIPKGGSLEQAIALIEHVDRTQAPDRLRKLADQYERAGKRELEVRARRAAIARESDHSLICSDRAEIVLASIQIPNKADAELAIEELRDSTKHGDPRCLFDAESVVWTLASEWRKLEVGRARLLRAWDRAAELSASPGKRAAALEIRSQLTGPKSTAR